MSFAPPPPPPPTNFKPTKIALSNETNVAPMPPMANPLAPPPSAPQQNNLAPPPAPLAPAPTQPQVTTSSQTANNSSVTSHVTTSQEMENLRKTDKWNIDSDVTLLAFMKGFKDRLFNKMDGVKKQLDQIVYDTKSTEVSLFNTFNEFLNLSNTQFVENRINDDEEVKKPSEPEKKEEKPTNPHENYNKAIQLGISALTVCSVPFEDTEEETNQTHVDKRLLKPLPFIIGTKEFFEDDLVGLKEEEEVVAVVESIKDEVPEVPNSVENPNLENQAPQEKKNLFGVPDELPGDELKFDSMFSEEKKPVPRDEPVSVFSSNLFSETRKENAVDEFDLDSMMNDLTGDIKKKVTEKKPSSGSDFAFDFDEKKESKKSEEKRTPENTLFSEEPEDKKKEKGMFDLDDDDEEEVKPKKREVKPELDFENNLFGEPTKKKEGLFDAKKPTKEDAFDNFEVDSFLEGMLGPSSDKKTPEVKKTEVEKKSVAKVTKKVDLDYDLFGFDEPKKETVKPVVVTKEEPVVVNPLKQSTLFAVEEPIQVKVEAKVEEQKVDPKKAFQSNIIAGLQKMNQGGGVPIAKKKESNLFSESPMNTPPVEESKIKQAVTKKSDLFSLDDPILDKKPSADVFKLDKEEEEEDVFAMIDEPKPKKTVPEAKKIEKSDIFDFEEEKKPEVKQPEPTNDKKDFAKNIIAGLKMNAPGGMPIKKKSDNLFDSPKSSFESIGILKSHVEKEEKEDTTMEIEHKEVFNAARDGNAEKPVLEHANLGRSKGAKKRPPKKLSSGLEKLDPVDVSKEDLEMPSPIIKLESPQPHKLMIEKEVVKKPEPVDEKKPTPEKKKTDVSSLLDDFSFEHQKKPKVVKEKTIKTQNLFSTNMDALFDEKKDEKKKETKPTLDMADFEVDIKKKDKKKNIMEIPEVDVKKKTVKVDEKSSLFDANTSTTSTKSLFEVDGGSDKKKKPTTDAFFDDPMMSSTKKEKKKTATSNFFDM